MRQGDAAVARAVQPPLSAQQVCDTDHWFFFVRKLLEGGTEEKMTFGGCGAAIVDFGGTMGNRVTPNTVRLVQYRAWWVDILKSIGRLMIDKWSGERPGKASYNKAQRKKK
jgi:hypothetical protein